MKVYFIVVIKFMAILACVPKVKAKAISEVVVDVKWGSEPGMVGIDTSDPHTFAIVPSQIDIDDKGNIYIYDGVNKRINKYNTKGEFIMDIPLLDRGTFAVGKDKIYVFSRVPREKISIYSRKNGSFLRSYDCETSWQEKIPITIRSFVISPQMEKDGNGSPVLISRTLLPKDYVFEIAFDNSTYKLTLRKEILGMFGITYPWVLAKRRKKEGKIVLINKEDKTKVIISPPQGYRYSFLGTDKKGNFYFNGSPSKRISRKIEDYSKVVYLDERIYKYNKNGELVDSTGFLLSSVQRPRITVGWGNTAELDKNGVFYKLIITLSGVKVMKWFFQEDGD
jgi:hypothetical protein